MIDATSAAAGGAVATAHQAAPRLDADAPLSARQRRWVDSTLAGLDLRGRVGQMLMVWVLGDYEHEDSPAFAEARRWVVEQRVGGVVMSLGSPVEVAAKVNALQRLAPVPLLVASDVEPGLGRLEGGVFAPSLMTAGSATVLPSNMAIGAAGDEHLAYEAGRVTARESRAVGIHMAFAPVADVNNNPANPVINTRSFGEDPHAVARLTAAFVRGLQEHGVAATAKHFPGHGDTDTDSHLALPVVSSDPAQLDSVELVPFRAAIGAGALGVMTAHIALPAIDATNTPATLAPAIVDGLLRDSLGFRGVTVTDALSMEGVGQGYTVERSAVLSVLAGADILLKPNDIARAIDAVVAAVGEGLIDTARIDRSARRILELKARLGIADAPLVSLPAIRGTVASPEHQAVADSIAARAITLLRDDGQVPLPPREQVSIVSYAPELDLLAGRAFAATVRAARPDARVTRIDPRVSRAQLDSIAAGDGRIVVTTHVRTIEGEGRFAIAPHVAAWVDSLAAAGRPVVVVAFSNPYVIRQFAGVPAYVVAYGRGEALERAAARALLGHAAIVGRAPISLPGFFSRGDGMTRPAATEVAR
ncbi:MAG TPA: glycoside hydrolase family 3 protein [Gemmatimonadaceae bacterium]